jgi:hypothetical protein
LYRVAAGPEIALDDDGCMMKLVLMWVVEAGPIWSKNGLPKQLRLKAARLAVGCGHTLGYMENNMKQYGGHVSADFVLSHLRQFPSAFEL